MSVNFEKMLVIHHGNLLNSTDREPLLGYKSKLTQILTIVGRQTDCILKVMESKVKVRQGRPWKSCQLDSLKQLYINTNLHKYLLYLGDKLFRFSKIMIEVKGQRVIAMKI